MSTSSASYSTSSEQLAPGGEYTIDMLNASLPASFVGKTSRTPFETRLLLEKLIRVTEIASAIKDPALRESLNAWVNGTRIHVRAEDTFNGKPVIDNTTILASRIKGDLAQQGGKSFFEPERAKEFGAKIADKVASDLK